MSHEIAKPDAPTSRAINSTPLVLGTIGLLVGIHVLGYLPFDWLQFQLLALGFEPWRFEILLHGQYVSPWLSAALSPVTYSLLHGDVTHLAMNVAFLLAFGTALQRQLGGVRTAILYVASSAGGAAAVMLTYYITEQSPFVLGASGAICGLFGALVHRWKTHRWVIIAVFIGVNLLFGRTGMPTSAGVQEIAWDAHIGGFAVGYLLFPLLARRDANR